LLPFSRFIDAANDEQANVAWSQLFSV